MGSNTPMRISLSAAVAPKDPMPVRRITDKKIISHAHAYHSHGQFEISCCCDINRENLTRFRQRWGEHIRFYTDIDQLIHNEEFDIASVTTTTDAHAEVIARLLEKEPVRLIICEKPFVSKLDELHEIKKRVKMHPEKVLLINFHRRYDPGFQKLADTMASGTAGKPVGFRAVFTKGLYHNGCHLLELIERLLGQIRRVVANENRVIDDDLYGHYFIETEKCSGSIANFDCIGYSLFEMDIYLESGLVRIADFGHRLEIHRPKESRLYRDYKMLCRDVTIEDSLKKRMLHTVDMGRKLIENGVLRKNGIFESHLALSEKLLILKERLASGANLVVFD